MDLAGKRIIVTGGASGIGAAIVRAYAAAGAEVASLDITDAPGTEAAEAATRAGPGRAAYRHCDVSQRQEVEAAFAESATAMGGLDVMVNVAGLNRRAVSEEITDDNWDQTFAVNAYGTMTTNQAALHYMKEKGGRIINFGSGAGITGLPGLAHYSASKAAVMAWTRTLAKEWGRYNITVNAVSPGIWTPMYERSRAWMGPEALATHDAFMAQAIPLGGKLGDPDRDLAPVLVFLAGDGARFITGQIICVDGGLTMVR